jgi:hypothetical protein
LATGVAGALGYQQLLGALLHFDCHAGRASVGLLSGALVLAVMAAGAWISWRTRLRSSEGATIGLVSAVSVMTAALSALLVAWMMLATLVIPPCLP